MARARVQFLPVLKDVKAAMVEFADEVNQALATVDAEIGRISQWLSQERPAYWKAEIRRREGALNKAKAEVARKRLISAPEPASVALEQRAVDRAKRRLEEAQKRMDAVRRWAPVWDRQALMYKTACHGISESVHADTPRALARLERMLQSLEEYTQLAAPTGDGPSNAGAEGDAPPAAEAPTGGPSP
jgi:hypothetical protein